jgi:gamma-glutamylcyclotransferase (GGCT)/AIG2-like uncharacterized protein YtfP
VSHLIDDAANEFLLFVYGTLMRDGPRAPVLAGQRFPGEVSTTSGYALYDLGPYPGLVRRDGAGPVHGELVSVANSLRDRLDRVEGAPVQYCLEEVCIEGTARPVFAYLYRGAIQPSSLIEGGRWDNRRAAPWDGDPS